jgi:hypothetical protein
MSFLTDSALKIAELVTLNIIEIDRPVLAFDVHKKQLIYTFIGRALENKEYVIELRINITELYRLERIIIYTPQEKAEVPVIIIPSLITTFTGEEFSIPITGSTQNEQITNTEVCEPFTCSVTHLEMLDKLKAAQEKGCV